MSKKELRSKYLFIIILSCIIDIALLVVWFYLRAVPVLSEINKIEDKIINIELASSYDSYNELEKVLNKIEKDYNLVFSIEDENKVIKNEIKNSISLFDKLIKINDKTYLVKAHTTEHISIGKIFIELFIFEVMVFIVILIIIFLFSRQIVFKPIDRIINDIKNYKFGKKITNNNNKNELNFIKNSFVKLANQLDEEKREQTRIIANINHDIRTPLTSIVGYSDLLLDNDLSKDDRLKYAAKINEKALHIKDILATFDDYLLNHEKIILKKNNIQIKCIVDELYKDYKIELENKNIDLIINTDILNEKVNIDILKIKRVFANIITNSIRYLDNNGKIIIDILDDDEFIKFVVKDTGPGVDAEILDKIFEPLFTTDTSRKISGLGLSICKEFIEMHHGNIKGYNDNGFVIEFTIPKSKQS